MSGAKNKSNDRISKDVRKEEKQRKGAKAKKANNRRKLEREFALEERQSDLEFLTESADVSFDSNPTLPFDLIMQARKGAAVHRHHVIQRVKPGTDSRWRM